MTQTVTQERGAQGHGVQGHGAQGHGVQGHGAQGHGVQGRRVQDRSRWWQWAACAGREPAWWSSEERPMWPAAVRLCLSCPVRDSCLEDAVRQGDNGVIRGGMLLVDTSRGYAAVPLICANCGRRPVRLTESGGVPRYCGRTCQVAGGQRGARGGGRVSLERRWAAGAGPAPPAPPRSSPVAP